MRIALALLPAFLISCKATTAEYLGKQEGYVAHSGFVLKVQMRDPVVKALKDGTAYTCTNEGDTVVLYTEERNQFGTRRNERNFELRPGDQFVKAMPLCFVLLKR